MTCDIAADLAGISRGVGDVLDAVLEVVRMLFTPLKGRYRRRRR